MSVRLKKNNINSPQSNFSSKVMIKHTQSLHVNSASNQSINNETENASTIKKKKFNLFCCF